MFGGGYGSDEVFLHRCKRPLQLLYENIGGGLHECPSLSGTFAVLN